MRTKRATLVVAATAMAACAAGGCLQILGDDATFVVGTGGAGGSTGTAGDGGTGAAGGTGGSGGVGGTGATTSSSACMPGDTRTCYTGPDGTEGVGECKAMSFIHSHSSLLISSRQRDRGK